MSALKALQGFWDGNKLCRGKERVRTKSVIKLKQKVNNCWSRIFFSWTRLRDGYIRLSDRRLPLRAVWEVLSLTQFFFVCFFTIDFVLEPRKDIPDRVPIVPGAVYKASLLAVERRFVCPKSPSGVWNRNRLCLWKEQNWRRYALQRQVTQKSKMEKDWS